MPSLFVDGVHRNYRKDRYYRTPPHALVEKSAVGPLNGPIGHGLKVIYCHSVLPAVGAPPAGGRELKKLHVVSRDDL
jgi:hypothetical protein